jgi:hypothetical protein
LVQSSQRTVTLNPSCEDQNPGTSVSVLPSSGEPAMLGGAVFVGPAACAPAGRTNAPTLAASASKAALVRCRNRGKALPNDP